MSSVEAPQGTGAPFGSSEAAESGDEAASVGVV